MDVSYRFSHMSRTIRALASSTKTSLRIDHEGLLSLQFLMPSPRPKASIGGDKQEAFIDFVASSIHSRAVWAIVLTGGIV
jgi:cell cycle checkpoint protein